MTMSAETSRAKYAILPPPRADESHNFLCLLYRF